MRNIMFNSLISSKAVSPLLSGLMGYWKLDESSGTIYDSTAYSNNSVAQSVTYSATGKINTSLSFNGTSNYVEFGDVCQPTTALTISSWVKCGTLSTERVIIENFGYNSGYRGYRLTIYDSNGWGYILAGTSNLEDVYVNTSTIHNNTWHHLVIIWSGDKPYHYTNGTKATAANSFSGPLDYNTGGFHEGLRLGIGLWDSGYFDGEIDEVGIWNRALTDTEVSILYNNGDGKSYPFI